MRNAYAGMKFGVRRRFWRNRKANFAILKAAFRDQQFFSEVYYRIEIPVRQRVYYANVSAYPLCPRCGRSLNREFMHFCNLCGQKLGWDEYVVDDE